MREHESYHDHGGLRAVDGTVERDLGDGEVADFAVEVEDGGVAGDLGGGGLVAGISEYVKRIGSPNTKVIGVETIDGDAMARSLEKGERVTLNEVGLFSDGTAVRIVGAEPFRICSQLMDGVVKANTDELCAAIKDVFEGIELSDFLEKD